MKIYIQIEDWCASFPLSHEGIIVAKKWLDSITPKVKTDETL